MYIAQLLSISSADAPSSDSVLRARHEHVCYNTQHSTDHILTFGAPKHNTHA